MLLWLEPVLRGEAFSPNSQNVNDDISRNRYCHILEHISGYYIFIPHFSLAQYLIYYNPLPKYFYEPNHITTGPTELLHLLLLAIALDV